FSVSLFILISGVATYFSYERNEFEIVSFKSNLIKQLPLLKKFIIAVLLNLLFVLLFLNPQGEINYYKVLTLNELGYFIVFFIQLKMITPLLLWIFKKSSENKFKNIYHIVTLIIILIISIIIMRFCNIFPFYGGGAYLLGGTYLFLYYFGIFLGSTSLFKCKSKRKRLIALIGSFSLCLYWFFMQLSTNFYLDKLFSNFFGSGINPPSIFLSVYAFLVLIVCYSLFSILEDISTSMIKKILYFLAFLGSNSLYIFMYHLLIRDVIFALFPSVINSMILLRVIVFPIMIIGAPVICFLVLKIKSRFKLI
ncbi:MAG: acyltransferase family protein, partial [Erysipelotrichales bacterium]|nr:acyltransferase family protein [Erysipelotrichales bacterium]